MIDILQSDKKDLFHIYSIEKLLYNEIDRLKMKNFEKKVLAKPIICGIPNWSSLKLSDLYSREY